MLKQFLFVLWHIILKNFKKKKKKHFNALKKSVRYLLTELWRLQVKFCTFLFFVDIIGGKKYRLHFFKRIYLTK